MACTRQGCRARSACAIQRRFDPCTRASLSNWSTSSELRAKSPLQRFETSRARRASTRRARGCPPARAPRRSGVRSSCAASATSRRCCSSKPANARQQAIDGVHERLAPRWECARCSAASDGAHRLRQLRPTTPRAARTPCRSSRLTINSSKGASTSIGTSASTAPSRAASSRTLCRCATPNAWPATVSPHEHSPFHPLKASTFCKSRLAGSVGSMTSMRALGVDAGAAQRADHEMRLGVFAVAWAEALARRTTTGCCRERSVTICRNCVS